MCDFNLPGKTTGSTFRAVAALVCVASLAACGEIGLKKLGTSEALSDRAMVTRGQESATVPEAALRAAVVKPITDGDHALGEWLQVIDGAERSIDLKTFIFRPDNIGKRVGRHLIDAADRGVRVRMLVDDLFHFFKKNDIGFLDDHPNIEVRVFNPLDRRIIPPVSFLLEYDRVNPRMHNKALVVDGETAIVGGRNIAAEYFRRNRDAYFSDLELLIRGPAVQDIASSFEDYWADEYSLGYAEVVRRARNSKNRPAFETPGEVEGEPVSRGLQDAFAPVAFTGRTPPEFPALGWLSYDPPAKLRAGGRNGPYPVEETVFSALEASEESVLIVTPYFIPDAEVVGLLTLLKAGVEILEYRANVVHPFDDGEKRRMPTTTLHAKMVLIDESHAILGSLNFDPRSIKVNAELMFHTESPELGQWLARHYDRAAADHAYRVTLGDDGAATWEYGHRRDRVSWTTEPAGAGSVLPRLRKTAVELAAYPDPLVMFEKVGGDCAVMIPQTCVRARINQGQDRLGVAIARSDVQGRPVAFVARSHIGSRFDQSVDRARPVRSRRMMKGGLAGFIPGLDVGAGSQ